MLSEHHFDSSSPAFIDTQKSPLDVRREVAQQGIGCRANVQRGRNQKQQGWLR
jgi:hypothetical protein